jgi:hypothetical protein
MVKDILLKKEDWKRAEKVDKYLITQCLLGPKKMLGCYLSFNTTASVQQVIRFNYKVVFW